MNPLYRAVLESLEPRLLLSTLYWHPVGGSTTWSTSAANWNTAADGSGSQVAWTNYDDAYFSGTGSQTMTVTGTVHVVVLDFTGSGVTLAGSGSIDAESFSNTGSFTIDGANLTLPDSENDGTINLTAGSLALSGGMTNYGNINLNGGSNSLSLTGSGIIDGGSISWTGGNVDCTTSIGDYTSLTLDGGSGQTFTLDGAGIDLPWDSSALTWDSGTVKLINAASLSNSGFGDFEIPSGDTVTLDLVSGSVSGLTNSGTLHWHEPDVTGAAAIGGTIVYDVPPNLYWDTDPSSGLDAGDGTWSTTAANWNTKADGTGDLVDWIPGSNAFFSASGTSTVTLPANVAANSITVSGTGYTIAGTGQNLNFAAHSTVSASTTFDNVHVNGGGATFTWSGGDLALTNGSTLVGALDLDGGSGTLTQTGNWFGGGDSTDWESGNVHLSDVTFYAGDATFNGGDNSFTLDSGSELEIWSTTWDSGDVTVDNLLVVESSPWTYLTLDGGDNDWTVTGTFKCGASSFTWDSGNVTLNDAEVTGIGSALAVIVPDDATLNINGSFSLDNATVENDGTLNWNSTDPMAGITNDATLNFTGTDTSGLPDLTNTGTVLLNSDADLSGLTLSGGTYEVTSGHTAEITSDFSIDGGALVIDEGATLDWSGGNLTFTDGTLLNDGGTMNLDGGAGTLTLDNSSLLNGNSSSGTVTWDSGNITTTDGGSITNDDTDGATFTVDAGDTVTLDVSAGSIAGTITNNGTLYWVAMDLSLASHVVGDGDLVYDPTTPAGGLGVVKADGSDLSQEDARTTGAYVLLNDDDDNYELASGNMVPDNAIGKTSGITGEKDLLPLNIYAFGLSIPGHYVLQLVATQPHLAFWNNSNKSGATNVLNIRSDVDSQVFVEGAAMDQDAGGAGQQLVKLRFISTDGSINAVVDWAKFTVYSIAGAQNVPDESTFTYTADVPGGAPSGGGTWEAGANAVLVGGQDPTRTQVLWGLGPDIGKVTYSPAPGFVGEWDANIVHVTVTNSLETPPQGKAKKFQDDGTSIVSWAPGELTWSNTITLAGKTANGAANRGIQFIDVGYVQTVHVDEKNATYRDGSTLTNSMQGNTYIDMATNNDGTLLGSWPWQDSAATSAPNVAYVTDSAATTFGINFHDRPRQEFPKNHGTSEWHFSDIEMSFTTMIVVKTRDPGVNLDYGDNPYYRIASLAWSINYNAEHVGTEPSYTATSAITPGVWNSDEDVQPLDVPDLPCANQVARSAFWTS